MNCSFLASLEALLRTDTDTGSQVAMGAYLDGKLYAFKVKKIAPTKIMISRRHAYDVDIVFGCWDTIANAGGVSSGYERLDTRLVEGEMNFLFLGQGLMVFLQELNVLSML